MNWQVGLFHIYLCLCA